MSTEDSTFIFAGGGTGGHLYPGLAVAQELLGICPSAKIVFACSFKAIDRKILDDRPYGVVTQSIRPLPRGLSGWWGFVRGYVSAGRMARDMVRDLKPAAVLGLGGYAAVPLVVAAARGGVPTAMLNPDAVPGKANRHLARYAQIIFTQFESTLESFPAGIRPKVRTVGCPIRPAFKTATREQGMAMLGLRTDRKVLLVFGGSLLAQSISQAVGAMPQELGRLAQSWQVLHISSLPEAQAIEQRLTAAGVSVRTVSYCDRMDLAYAAADLVLARAGAGTVAELAAVGRASILLPYPHHRDEHQRLNAEALAREGTAVVVPDLVEPSENAAQLRQLMIPIMSDAQRLDRMAGAAGKLGKLGKPDAAGVVAAYLAQSGGAKQ